MVTLKATLYSANRQPIDTLIAVKSIKDYNENKKEYQRYALTKICTERGWRYSDLTKYGYTAINIQIHKRQIY